jgi:hypothetical protein
MDLFGLPIQTQSLQETMQLVDLLPPWGEQVQCVDPDGARGLTYAFAYRQTTGRQLAPLSESRTKNR